MGLNQLDGKLAPYLDFNNGIFIEAGANDGVKQSNTYSLEALRSWKGILIEPVPHLFDECVKNRKKSKVFNAALVSDDYTEDVVELTYADLMTIVKAESGNENYSNQHIKKAKALQSLSKTYDFEAKAVTLNQVIEDSGFDRIDFISLDIEGYEAEALKGLDLCKWKPKYILLEVRNIKEVQLALGRNYKIIEELTSTAEYRDILFQRIS
jgi:FkbM family methyltransferase